MKSSKRVRHTPERMCVICRKRFPKSTLLRHVCPDSPQGTPTPDPKGVMPGRGFYVCADEACRAGLASYKGWLRNCKGVRHD